MKMKIARFNFLSICCRYRASRANTFPLTVRFLYHIIAFSVNNFARSWSRGILWAVILAACISARAGGPVSDCSQQGLMNAIAGGGTATFTTNCTLTLTAPIVIDAESTTIDSGGFKVTISGGGSAQLFYVSGNLQLVGLTLANGKGSSGGGLYISSGVNVYATNCTFNGNAATGATGSTGANGANKSTGFGGKGQDGSSGVPGLGGAIYNLGSLTLSNCVFTTNSAVGGNGGAGGNGGNVSGTIGQGGDGGAGGNGATGAGGAIYTAGSLELVNCTLSGNSASGGVGGSGGSAGSSRTSSTNGTGAFPGLAGPGGSGGPGAGGGVYNGLTVMVIGCTFSGNTGQGGASAVGGNRSTGVGTTGLPGGDADGGGFCNAMIAALTNCTFFGNTVRGGTGGTGGSGSGSLATAGDGGNGGAGNGGCIFNSSSIAIVNCTVSSGGAFGGTNGVAGSGGFSGSDGNTGQSRGGNLASLSGTVELMNTIVANNIGGSNGYGAIEDEGHNLSSDSSLPLSGIGSRSQIAPMLAPLANNGGPTMTMALLKGSPAINAVGLDPARFPATDQRGVQRPIGKGADIGAYEAGTPMTSPILQPTLSSNRLSIVVPTQTGLSYLLQYKNNLTDSAWISFSTNAGTGGLLTNQDLTTNQPGRYYRMKVQSQ